MEKKALVTYASKYGGTAGIAEKIGEVLREAEIETDVLPVDRVGDLTPYRAVILGSAVYIGGWRKAAVNFLRTRERDLADHPVWIFSSGPTGPAEQGAFMGGGLLPQALQPVADRIHPRDVVIFGGAAFAERLKGLDKWILNNVKAPLGDFRDWEAITAWAETIGRDLKCCRES